MDYNSRKLVPYIPPAEYDNVANGFLERFCPDALKNPMPVPIEDIARNGLGLDVQYICLSEELDMAGDEAEFPTRVGIKDRDGHGVIRGYLESCQACDACLEVFEECWEEYAQCEKSRSNKNSSRR